MRRLEASFDPGSHDRLLESADDLIKTAMQAAKATLEAGAPEFECTTGAGHPDTTMGVDPVLPLKELGTGPLPGSLPKEDWVHRTMACTDIVQFGALLAWGMSKGFVLHGMKILANYAKPCATHVASSSLKGLFPLPVDLSFFSDSDLPPAVFPRPLCVKAWVELLAWALNHLYGLEPPFPSERRGAGVKKSLEVLHGRVERFLKTGGVSDKLASEIWSELKTKSINYVGEEVAVAQTLTVDQVLSSMPPLGHGGSVELAPLLEGRSRYLLLHPEEVMLPSEDVPPGKCTAKVHIKSGEEVMFFKLLKSRGIITFVSEDAVHCGPKGRYLSGLFGVPKPGKLSPSGLPVLRLIMNLIPINRAMDIVLGDISELPTASVWQQLVLSEGDSLTVSQADMASAFYLFRLPPGWEKYLCFNYRRRAEDVGEPGQGWVYPSCTVLPMGWSSSVGLMQMASRELLRRAHLPPGQELRKRSLVPTWFLDLARQVPKGGSWWQVYLDNFMAAEVARADQPAQQNDVNMHSAAVASWDQHGVLCSHDKHVYGSHEAIELGVQLQGNEGLIGASGNRIMGAILGTVALLGERMTRAKHVQIILGRWVFILQFRRPAMAVLSRAWDYITDPSRRWATWDRLCRELSLLICLAPLLQADVRTPFSDIATCSDASEWGGAVATSSTLSPLGKDLTNHLLDETSPRAVPILVVSCFNGVGGTFRCYDIQGVMVEGLVSIEIDPAARRTVRRAWPHALEVSDINQVDLKMVKQWANAFPRVQQVHVWGGFPCVHLSSARFNRQNLAGEGSNLFFKLVEVIEMIESVFSTWAVVEFVVENVFSMDISARNEISRRLGIKPLKVDPADCSPISRPRLAWVSKEVLASSGVILVDHDDFAEVQMSGEFPPLSSWVRPGWQPTTEGVTYPTCMKSIPRDRPPPRPAGLNRCDDASVRRWESDSFRFPPYQYKYQFLFVSDCGELRYMGVDERELVLGLGPEATKFCFSASLQKSQPTDYWDKRYSLLGDGFSILSFAWIAGQLLRGYQQPLSPQEILDRFGLVPGHSAASCLKIPLNRVGSFGGSGQNRCVSELVGLISRQVAQNGSDVSIALGAPFISKGASHPSLRAGWWAWKILYSTHWHFSSHINTLEMRMILQSALWRTRFPHQFSTRWLHLADSMVCNYILSKGRTSSRMLQPLVRQLSAVLLAANAIPLYGHVDSIENPTDEASRT